MTFPEVQEEPAAGPSLAAYEAAFAATFLAALTAWLASVSAAVLAGFVRFGVAPNAIALFSRGRDWIRAVDSMMPDLEAMARLGWLQGNQDLGTRIPFDPGNQFVQEQLARTRNLLVRISDEVYKDIVNALNAAVAAGQGTEGQAEAVRRVLNGTGSENWPARARTVAVTECLPGDMTVNGANIVAAYRRWYEGNLVTVFTENGNHFTGTPNHPVLTIRGWVGLGELLEGDGLVGDGGAINYAVMPLHPDIEAAPATIAEVFDALQAVGVVSRVTGGQPDFHGDGLDGNIDISSAHGSLTYGNFSEITEGRMNFDFELPALTHALLTAQCSPLSYNSVIANKSMTAGTDLDPRSPQDIRDGFPGTSELIGEIIHGSTSLVLAGYVGARNSITYPVNARSRAALNVGLTENLVDSANSDSEAFGKIDDFHAFPVVIDNVIGKVSSPFKGHVYNLSTVHGYFTAHGIFTGNTNRAYGFGTVALGQTMQQQMKVAVLKRWDSKEDTRVRAAHEAADGQTVSISQPFIVGGEALMAPGDPSGSPWNVIACRCRARLRKG